MGTVLDLLTHSNTVPVMGNPWVSATHSHAQFCSHHTHLCSKSSLSALFSLMLSHSCTLTVCLMLSHTPVILLQFTFFIFIYLLLMPAWLPMCSVPLCLPSCLTPFTLCPTCYSVLMLHIYSTHPPVFHQWPYVLLVVLRMDPSWLQLTSPWVMYYTVTQKTFPMFDTFKLVTF